jgi:hypothetical protein
MIMVVVLVATVSVLAALFAWLNWRTRREFAVMPGVFRCNVRLRSDEHLGSIPPKWAKWPCRAFWVHDVCVVRRGLLRPRVWHLPVHMADGGLAELNQRSVRGLGRRPVSVRVFLDDQQEIELAANDRDRALLVGPFLAVAVGRLPSDPAPGVNPLG